jgi:CBS domain-containing protein
MRVVDVMTSQVEVAHPDWTLKQVARTMIDAGVSGLPVVDDDGVIVGIITEADFIEAEAERAPGRRRFIDTVFGEKKTKAPSTVAAAMTTAPFVIDRNAKVTDAAKMMTAHHVRRLPVVTPDGKVEGIVSRSDIVAAFARDDEEIADAVHYGVIRRILMLDAPDVSVRVTDGVVTLSGEVPTRTDAKLLEELAGGITGVVRCDSELSWAFDDIAAGPPA